MRSVTHLFKLVHSCHVRVMYAAFVAAATADLVLHLHTRQRLETTL